MATTAAAAIALVSSLILAATLFLMLVSLLRTTPAWQRSSLQPPRVTLVVDLDETLVHARGPTAAAVVVRPHAVEFLRFAGGAFREVVLFTAALREYADPVVDALEAAAGVRVARRFYRDSCDALGRKDLTLVEPDLRRVAIVDNTPGAYALQPGNGIPVPSFWADGGDDDHLARLAARMAAVDLGRADDVRPAILRLLRLHPPPQGQQLQEPFSPAPRAACALDAGSCGDGRGQSCGPAPNALCPWQRGSDLCCVRDPVGGPGEGRCLPCAGLDADQRADQLLWSAERRAWI